MDKEGELKEYDATAPLVFVGAFGLLFWWMLTQGHKYVPPEARAPRRF